MRFDEAVDHFGGRTQLRKRLGVGRAAVHAWSKTGIPPLRQYQIECLTDGALQADDPTHTKEQQEKGDVRRSQAHEGSGSEVAVG